jgi:transcriptional regulator with XRE-family HTH domain
VEPQAQLGARLRQLRHDARLTQEQLGFLCNMDMSEISRIERGARDPRLTTLLRIAVALELELSVLVEGIRPVR